MRLRNAAPSLLRTLLDEQLGRTVPWVERSRSVASPGNAFARVNRGDTVLSYRIPAVPEKERTIPGHVLSDRVESPPIRITLDQMKSVAKRVDELEGQEDWPSSLPQLRLSERLEKLEIEGLVDGFFEDGAITLEGAVHVLGMLSSGKSTLVWAIIFALALGRTNKRIAMLVGDTVQGATVIARLRRHGVTATVLSSPYNRERHLNSIHWQQGLSSEGWSLASVGTAAENFSIACPLDGMQREAVVVRGNGDQAGFPAFREKPCHKLFQSARDADQARETDADADLNTGSNRSCPLWARCPAQEQQRSAVDAQVVALTPQAFVHMTPDKWTTPHHLTLPELLQCTFDLVIMDEVDSMQRSMDDILAPRSPIMGGDRDVYAPAIGTRTSEALRERSGWQFRREVNAKWQANFHTLYRLIGALYAILQNEQADLREFYANTPFTAASILYRVWHRRQEVLGLVEAGRSFDDPAVEEEFLEVVKVAAGISRFSRASSISNEQTMDAEEEEENHFRDKAFDKACKALQSIAREVCVADYYEDLVIEIEKALEGDLAAFHAEGDGEAHPKGLGKRKKRPRSSARRDHGPRALPLLLVGENPASRRKRLRHRRPPNVQSSEQPHQALPHAAAVESRRRGVRASLRRTGTGQARHDGGEAHAHQPSWGRPALGGSSARSPPERRACGAACADAERDQLGRRRHTPAPSEDRQANGCRIADL